MTDGIITGLFLQFALGPVFFYILGITMDSDAINSLSAVLAVTLADYIFIVLSLLGVGKLLQEDKKKRLFGLISSALLILFGVMILYKGIMFEATHAHGAGSMAWTPVRSFTSCFILTISSPLTIVFWGSIFSAKAIEKGYLKNELVLFGLAAGASTFIFLFSVMTGLSFFKSAIPPGLVQMLNCGVGLLLITYGITRTATISSKNKDVHTTPKS